MEPILNGTLQEKVTMYRKAHDLMKKTNLPEDLKEEIKGLGTDIRRHLMGGEQIEDDVLDYCFRNFTGGDLRKTALDFLNLVHPFMEKIDKLYGSPILVTYESPLSREEQEPFHMEKPSGWGVISDSCEFEIIKSFRYLLVPVVRLHLFDKDDGKWEPKKDEYFPSVNDGHVVYIPDDIFKYTINSRFTKPAKREVWKTDYKSEMWAGGPGPDEVIVYLGDNAVNKGIKEHKFISKGN